MEIKSQSFSKIAGIFPTEEAYFFRKNSTFCLKNKRIGVDACCKTNVAADNGIWSFNPGLLCSGFSKSNDFEFEGNLLKIGKIKTEKKEANNEENFKDYSQFSFKDIINLPFETFASLKKDFENVKGLKWSNPSCAVLNLLYNKGFLKEYDLSIFLLKSRFLLGNEESLLPCHLSLKEEAFDIIASLKKDVVFGTYSDENTDFPAIKCDDVIFVFYNYVQGSKKYTEYDNLARSSSLSYSIEKSKLKEIADILCCSNVDQDSTVMLKVLDGKLSVLVDNEKQDLDQDINSSIPAITMEIDLQSFKWLIEQQKNEKINFFIEADDEKSCIISKDSDEAYYLLKFGKY